jgi:hypothetical protein
VRTGVSDEGLLLVGGEEAGLLLAATVDSFVAGVWVATILCAQATSERVLAAIVSLRELPGYGFEGPRGWEGWGLGRLIRHVLQQGWIPADLLDDVESYAKPGSRTAIGEDPWIPAPSAAKLRRLSGTRDGMPTPNRFRLASSRRKH